jgi:hypothetical protein
MAEVFVRVCRDAPDEVEDVIRHVEFALQATTAHDPRRRLVRFRLDAFDERTARRLVAATLEVYDRQTRCLELLDTEPSPARFVNRVPFADGDQRDDRAARHLRA